ncbi:hypothetical protein J2751_002060 [Halorubrum alkaliphilum]|uniref:GATase domain protein n=1 Tax=Halorubrum alkaliphilum TaxID=261290 RepID=A0A8T4GFW2_9EURY|nr:hypothetical protein [Halorubrum alkaliphilum]MBP1923023.1 hypothetical protein [Halorubrum alkaliphilum]
MSTLRTAIGVFALVFAVTLGVVAVGGVVLDDGTPSNAEIETDHWELDEVAAESAESSGEIDMESAELGNTVVIHVGVAAAGGGEPLAIPIDGERDPTEASVGTIGGAERDVGPLASTLVANGHDVVFYQDEFADGPLPQVLADADAFLTTNPAALGPAEADAVEEFIEADGRTVVAADPGSAGATTELLGPLGAYASPGYVYDMGNNDANYLSPFVTPAADTELTDGVERAVFRGIAPVGVTDRQGDAVFETGEGARLSTTREAGTYDAAVTAGELALIGDSSFLAPENAYRADNDVLIGNVADFLVTGEEPDVDPTPPGGEPIPPGGEPIPPGGEPIPPEDGDEEELPDEEPDDEPPAEDGDDVDDSETTADE